MILKPEDYKLIKQLQKKSLNEIAEENWIDILVWDLSEILDWDVSWIITYIKKDWKEEFKIYLNSKETKNEQRLTLAYNLWHYFLHKDLLKKKWTLIVNAGDFRKTNKQRYDR